MQLQILITQYKIYLPTKIPQVRELNPNIRFSGSNDTILNFHNFIISPNANDMSNMFSMIHNTTINMTTLNTINITNMAYMFNYIERYCNIYTNNLDTRNVTNMSYMFAHFAISSNFYSKPKEMKKPKPYDNSYNFGNSDNGEGEI